MSLNALGIAANIFGVVTPAKEIGEIIKGIGDSIQEVKMNEASTSYWDKTLEDRARDVYSFMARSKHSGTSDLQTRSLLKLFESLVVLRKEILENNRHSYLIKLWASGDIRRKIRWVEMEMRQCQELFLTDTQIIQIDMLSQINRGVREIANRDGRSYTVESTVIRWKIPGKADSNDPLAVEYAYLVKKSRTLIYELKSNSEYVQEKVLEAGRNLKILSFRCGRHPEGNPLFDCEDANSRAIRLCQMLRNRDFNDASFIEWLIDSEELSTSLYRVGLTKEARQMQEFICQMWSFLASRRGTAPIFSRLACSLHNMAVSYSKEGRHAEAHSHVEQAIQIYRGLGDSFLPNLAQCLSCRSLYLCYLDRFEDSLASAQESAGIWRRLVNDDPSLYGPDLVECLMRQAQALIYLSRPEEALWCSQEALQLLSKVSPRYKEVHSYLYAQVFWLIAESHYNLGDFEQAREYGRRALSVFHVLVRDRPLVYSHNLSNTISYSSWSGSDHQLAVSVLDESLTVCLMVDTTFTAPHLADILDRRAAALISSSRYAEALESYDQAIDVRRRLLEDEEDVDSKHFKALLKVFRLRASCLLSLHRRNDALSSLDAAQDAIVSRLKTKIDENITTFITRELEDEWRLLEDCAGPDCIELISALRSCKKVLSHIQEFKCASRTGSTARLDLGMLSTLEHSIHMMVGRLDLALLSIQDAVDFYRSQIKQNRTRSIQAGLVTSLVLHTRCCIRLDSLEQALCSMDDAVNQLRVDLEHDVEGSVSHFFEIFDLYSDISNRILDEKDCRQGLRMFLEAAIGILRSAVMTSEARTRTALAWLLDDRAHLLYQVKSYQEAMSSSEESVSIYRILVAEDVEMHQWTFAWCLQLFAKALLANGNNNAALSSIEEAVDIQQHIEDKDPKGAGNLRRSISLRAEILYRTGLAGDMKDSLSKRWPLRIPNPTKSENEQS